MKVPKTKCPLDSIGVFCDSGFPLLRRAVGRNRLTVERHQNRVEQASFLVLGIAADPCVGPLDPSSRKDRISSVVRETPMDPVFGTQKVNPRNKESPASVLSSILRICTL